MCFKKGLHSHPVPHKPNSHWILYFKLKPSYKTEMLLAVGKESCTMIKEPTKSLPSMSTIKRRLSAPVATKR